MINAMHVGWWSRLALCVLLVPTVHAAELVKSYPEEGSEFPRTVRGVHLWFDESPMGQDFAVAIVGDGTTYEVAGLHAMSSNDLMASVPDSLPDGDYEMRWKVGSSLGAVSFSVGRPEGAVDDVWEPPLDIGVVLYDGAEPLDVCGPLELWMNMLPDYVRILLIA